MRFADLPRWGLGLALAAFMVYVPYQYYRYRLEHTKRLRPVVDGRFYRSGCLSANGFRDFLQSHKIKTVINLWDESPDPLLPANRYDPTTVAESDLCKELGVNFKFVYVELLPEHRVGKERLQAIDDFLKIMDDESSYPVLIHCKAGLHRTGVMSAIYRMEYDGWLRADAMRELCADGFGHFTANSTNEYIQQYVLNYQPRAKTQGERSVDGTVASRPTNDPSPENE